LERSRQRLEAEPALEAELILPRGTYTLNDEREVVLKENTSVEIAPICASSDLARAGYSLMSVISLSEELKVGELGRMGIQLAYLHRLGRSLVVGGELSVFPISIAPRGGTEADCVPSENDTVNEAACANGLSSEGTIGELAISVAGQVGTAVKLSPTLSLTLVGSLAYSNLHGLNLFYEIEEGEYIRRFHVGDVPWNGLEIGPDVHLLYALKLGQKRAAELSAGLKLAGGFGAYPGTVKVGDSYEGESYLGPDEYVLNPPLASHFLLTLGICAGAVVHF
jgi:hypothetical protein